VRATPGMLPPLAVPDWSKANGYRLAGPRWEIYGNPDPSTGNFDVQVFWSLVAP
jgi:hypothetical protein